MQTDVNVGTHLHAAGAVERARGHVVEIAQRVRQHTAGIAGVRIVVIQPPSLSIGGGSKPVQVVLGGTDYNQLAAWRDKVFDRVNAENPRILN